MSDEQRQAIIVLLRADPLETYRTFRLIEHHAQRSMLSEHEVADLVIGDLKRGKPIRAILESLARTDETR